MALTGQIFATRVAVGLAIPSPQAMAKAGNLLAMGIEKMHNKVQAMGRRAMMSEDYAKDLESMNGTFRDMGSQMGNEMQKQLETQLRSIDELTKGSLSRSFQQTGQAHKDLMSQVSKPISDQFEASMGMFGGKGGNFLAEAASYMKLEVDQRTELLEKAQNMVWTQAEFIRGEEERLRLGYEAGDISDEAYNKGQARLQGDRDLLKTYERQYDRLGYIKTQVDRIEHAFGKLAMQSYDFSMNLLSTVDAIRSGFNVALRNSLFLLTAIGYKLNQHTQDLIEYERELLNANSVFNLTNENLFEVGNSIVEFGNKFGITVQNGAEGLYQLASAGVTAEDALKILPETLKLSMAVQGDHNTISKLTAQTLFGFGMEMDQAAEVTDKFAYAIQKSLIEYQDLSSAVKFALPFFTSTGQSIDQLLGALQILTNRALEAGIAGRGLRQALAEFAESALDAEVGFRKMGVEILNAEGEMLQLSEIAERFAAAVGPDTASNTELLTTLIEDLNVRGATAFIHLVQASDEFTQAVKDTENAGGQLDEMVRIQNESLMAQVQILKNNILSIFALRDANYEGTEFINAFHESVVNMVQGFKDLIIVEEDGTQVLTEFGKNIQKFAIDSMDMFAEVLHEDVIPAIEALMDSGLFTKENLKLLIVPLKILAGIAEIAVKYPNVTKAYFGFVIFGMLGLFNIGKKLFWLFEKGWKIVKPFTRWADEAVETGAKFKLSKEGGEALAKGTGKKVATKGLSRMIPYIGWAMLAMDAHEYVTKGTVWGFDVPGGDWMGNGGYTRRGAGGPAGGSPYMVGEHGPELFIPGQTGQVLNTAETNNILGSDVVMRNVTIGIDSFGGIV